MKNIKNLDGWYHHDIMIPIKKLFKLSLIDYAYVAIIDHYSQRKFYKYIHDDAFIGLLDLSGCGSLYKIRKRLEVNNMIYKKGSEWYLQPKFHRLWKEAYLTLREGGFWTNKQMPWENENPKTHEKSFPMENKSFPLEKHAILYKERSKEETFVEKSISTDVDLLSNISNEKIPTKKDTVKIYNNVLEVLNVGIKPLDIKAKTTKPILDKFWIGLKKKEFTVRELATIMAFRIERLKITEKDKYLRHTTLLNSHFFNNFMSGCPEDCKTIKDAVSAAKFDKGQIGTNTAKGSHSARNEPTEAQLGFTPHVKPEKVNLKEIGDAKLNWFDFVTPQKQPRFESEMNHPTVKEIISNRNKALDYLKYVFYNWNIEEKLYKKLKSSVRKAIRRATPNYNKNYLGIREMFEPQFTAAKQMNIGQTDMKYLEMFPPEHREVVSQYFDAPLTVPKYNQIINGLLATIGEELLNGKIKINANN